MSIDIVKAVALASKIAAKAEDTLAGIEREMRIMKWPDQFKVIMWEAIAEAAQIRAQSLTSQPRGGPDA